MWWILRLSTRVPVRVALPRRVRRSPAYAGSMDMSSAGVGCRSRECCGTVWFCQVGVRTYLRSHQAPPEEMSLPLNVHLTGDLKGCG